MSLNYKLEELLLEPIALDYGLRHYVGDDELYGREQIVELVDTVLFHWLVFVESCWSKGRKWLRY